MPERADDDVVAVADEAVVAEDDLIVPLRRAGGSAEVVDRPVHRQWRARKAAGGRADIRDTQVCVDHRGGGHQGGGGVVGLGVARDVGFEQGPGARGVLIGGDAEFNIADAAHAIGQAVHEAAVAIIARGDEASAHLGRAVSETGIT